MRTLFTPSSTTQRPWVRSIAVATLAVLVLAGSEAVHVDAGSASTLNSRVNRVALTRQSRPTTSAPKVSAGSARSYASTSKVPLDTPVADGAPFHPPSRGCGFTPASALPRTNTTSTSTTTPHAPFALGHCRLLEIGDSLGDDLEYGLRHELQYTPDSN